MIKQENRYSDNTENIRLSQEQVLYTISTTLQALVIFVLQPLLLWLYSGIITSVAYFVTLCVIIACVVSDRRGNYVKRWLKSNPRIMIFLTILLCAIDMTLPIFYYVKPNFNTTGIMVLYLTFCGTILGSLAFILFVGIDSSIKQLQRDQLMRELLRRPYVEMRECCTILQDYADRYGCEMKPQQINPRRNATMVVYALERLGELSVEISIAGRLSFTNLSHADLQGCKIKDMDLSYSKFTNTDLTDTSFTNVKLYRVDFRFADLNGSDLTKERLDEQGAVYDNTTLF
jgi:Pentapeptide repeats (8 copies)